MDEKFSVSICVYGKDNPKHFDVALSSIINQTLLPNEIVLTVDGLIPDEIEAVIEKYRSIAGERLIAFKVVYLEKNLGHGEARRICFENCTHDLIALMDADDISVPERFEKQVAYLRTNPKLSIIGGTIQEFIGVPENCVGKRIVPETDSEIKHYMKKRCPMNQVTVMFKKNDVATVGGYIDWYCEEDYYLWIRMALAHMRFGNVPEFLVNVRVGEEMYARRGGWKYYKSEAKLQKYMLKNEIINFPTYIANKAKRFILQVLMPNRIRGWVFQKFARRK